MKKVLRNFLSSLMGLVVLVGCSETANSGSITLEPVEASLPVSSSEMDEFALEGFKSNSLIILDEELCIPPTSEDWVKEEDWNQFLEKVLQLSWNTSQEQSFVRDFMQSFPGEDVDGVAEELRDRLGTEGAEPFVGFLLNEYPSPYVRRMVSAAVYLGVCTLPEGWTPVSEEAEELVKALEFER